MMIFASAAIRLPDFSCKLYESTCACRRFIFAWLGKQLSVVQKNCAPFLSLKCHVGIPHACVVYLKNLNKTSCNQATRYPSASVTLRHNLRLIQQVRGQSWWRHCIGQKFQRRDVAEKQKKQNHRPQNPMYSYMIAGPWRVHECVHIYIYIVCVYYLYIYIISCLSIYTTFVIYLFLVITVLYIVKYVTYNIEIAIETACYLGIWRDCLSDESSRSMWPQTPRGPHVPDFVVQWCRHRQNWCVS